MTASRSQAAAALLDALAARRGIVCAVGAGGKKSTLYRLAEAHLVLGTARIGLTATVMTAPPPRELAQERLIASVEELAAQIPGRAATHRLLLFAQPSAKPGRLAGVPPAALPALHAAGRFEVTLVKADGARMRWIKAPDPDEPLVPDGIATLLPVVSAKAIGRPLADAVAHRPERLSAVTGAAAGETLSPAHVARLLASEQGALQRAGSATVVPVINMVEDETDLRRARAAAEQALARTRRFARVVLARMAGPDPLIEVIGS